MQLGIIGLGRMGSNMAQRLMAAGHDMHVNDINGDAVASLIAKGAKGSSSLANFVGGLKAPRAIWLMLPAAIVDKIITNLAPLLQPGDIVIDGGQLALS